MGAESLEMSNKIDTSIELALFHWVCTNLQDVLFSQFFFSVSFSFWLELTQQQSPSTMVYFARYLIKIPLLIVQSAVCFLRFFFKLNLVIAFHLQLRMVKIRICAILDLIQWSITCVYVRYWYKCKYSKNNCRFFLIVVVVVVVDCFPFEYIHKWDCCSILSRYMCI